MKPVKVIHTGTGVTVGHFYTFAEAKHWLDHLGVTATYKDQNYRIVGHE